nr:hypothetical protein I308_01082 [Cryptococcus tetragattii IND107]
MFAKGVYILFGEWFHFSTINSISPGYISMDMIADPGHYCLNLG